MLSIALVVAMSAPAHGSLDPTIDVDAYILTVEPERVVLGETTQALVRIQANVDDGIDDPPMLAASTGSVDLPRRVGPGEWTANYVPPSSTFPQAALLSVRVVRGVRTAVACVAVPLWAQALAAVTTKPNAAVTVAVADIVYGPVQSDARGDVRVPILVPPGVTTAVASSVDLAGNRTNKVIPLGAPGFERLHLVPLDDPVPVDGRSVGRVVVFSVDDVGSLSGTGDVVAKTTVGVIESVRRLAPGINVVTWRPTLTTAREAVVTVASALAPKATTSTRLRLLLAAPVRAEITLGRTALSADDTPIVPVRVVVFDEAGAPVPIGAVRIDVDAGRIERHSGDLTRELEWSLPRTRERQEARLVVVNPNADNAIVGTATLNLLPGRPSQLRLELPAESVGDGVAVVPVVVSVIDGVGNALLPQGVALELPRGRLVDARVDVDDRKWRASFIPPPTDADTSVEVVARMGELMARAPVRIRAQRKDAWLVGAALASSWSYGDVVAVGPELSTLLRLPILDGALHAGMTLGLHEGIAVASGASFSSWRSWPMWLELGWRPWLTPGFGLHLGGVGGLIFVDASTGAGASARRTIDPAAAVAGVVGVVVPVGPGLLDVGLRVGVIGMLDASPAVPAMPLGAGLVAAYRFTGALPP